MPSDFSRKTARVWLLLIVIAGTALRFSALSYGLPFVYNPDEVAIMNRALALPGNGFNPNNFLYPSLYFYVLLACEAASYLTGRALGVFTSLAAFERSYFTDPTWIFLAGRSLTAICGVVTIWLTYLLGRRLSSRTAGLVAATVLAVSPIAVRDAHYVKHDVPVTMLIVLATLALHAAMRRRAKPRRDHAAPQRTLRRWVIAGAVAGLAMSTHYYAIFLALPIAVAALWPTDAGQPFAVRLRWLAAAGIAATVTFIAGSPFLVLEPARLMTDFIGNRQIVVDRTTEAAGLFGSLGFYLRVLILDGVGIFPAILAAAGVWSATKGGRTSTIALLIFPIAFLLFIGNTFPATRYLNPVLPFAAVLAGIGGAWGMHTQTRKDFLEGRLTVRGYSMTSRWNASFLIVASFLSSITTASHGDGFFAQTDTRTQAYDWIAANLPPGSSVLVQPYSVQLRQSRAGLIEALRATVGSEANASTRFAKQLALDPYPAPSYRTIYLGVGGLDQDKIYVDPAVFAGGTLDALRARAVTHVILKRYNQADPALLSLDRALIKDAQLIVTFSPYRASASLDTRAAVPPFLHNSDARIDAALERPGPIVEIWQVR